MLYICLIFLNCKTKKCTTLTENMQLKLDSPRYFPAPFNPSLQKSEIYIRKCCR